MDWQEIIVLLIGIFVVIVTGKYFYHFFRRIQRKENPCSSCGTGCSSCDAKTHYTKQKQKEGSCTEAVEEKKEK